MLFNQISAQNTNSDNLQMFGCFKKLHNNLINITLLFELLLLLVNYYFCHFCYLHVSSPKREC